MDSVVRTVEEIVSPFDVFVKGLRQVLIEGWFVDTAIRIGIKLKIVLEG